MFLFVSVRAYGNISAIQMEPVRLRQEKKKLKITDNATATSSLRSHAMQVEINNEIERHRSQGNLCARKNNRSTWRRYKEGHGGEVFKKCRQQREGRKSHIQRGCTIHPLYSECGAATHTDRQTWRYSHTSLTPLRQSSYPPCCGFTGPLTPAVSPFCSALL